MGLRRPVTARGVGTVQRILLAAADRFRGSGYYGTSLTDIAAAAGVSHGSVYTYWADREALFTTLAQDAVRRRSRPGWQALDGGLRHRTGWAAGWTAGSPCSVCTAPCSTSGPTRSTLPAIAELTARMNAAIDEAAAAFIDASSPAPTEDPRGHGSCCGPC